jgi:hypothetical protein
MHTGIAQAESAVTCSRLHVRGFLSDMVAKARRQLGLLQVLGTFEKTRALKKIILQLFLQL